MRINLHNLQSSCYSYFAFQASRDYTMRQVSGAIEDIIHAIQKTPEDVKHDTTNTAEPGHFTNKIQKVHRSLFYCNER